MACTEVHNALDDQHPHDQGHDADDIQHRTPEFHKVPDRLKEWQIIKDDFHRFMPFFQHARKACRQPLPGESASRRLARLCTKVCRNTVGMATTRPSTVVTRAVEIPPAISFGSPAPYSVMAWNVTIIPVTVPSRPSSGATTEMIFRNGQHGVEFRCFLQDVLHPVSAPVLLHLNLDCREQSSEHGPADCCRPARGSWSDG